MSTATTIQWVVNPDGTLGRTWNPVRGCSLDSPGCTNCYAMRTAFRFNGEGLAYEGLTRARKSLGPVWTGEVRVCPDMLPEPMRVRKPTGWFVNSMADLWHLDVPDEFIAAVLGVMAATPWHLYKILTKRSERMLAWFRAYPTAWWGGSVKRLAECAANMAVGLTERERRRLLAVPVDAPFPLPNLILGVSAENQEYADLRIPHLRATPAAHRMVSMEPLLGPVTVRELFAGEGGRVGQVIIGGESGPRARLSDLAWGRELLRECAELDVLRFYKQAGHNVVDSSRVDVLNADGRVWFSAAPDDPEVRSAAAIGRRVVPHVVRLVDSHGGDLGELGPEFQYREGFAVERETRRAA